MVLPFKETTEM